MARWKACRCGAKMPSEWRQCGDCEALGNTRLQDSLTMRTREDRLSWFHAAHEINSGYQPQPSAGEKLEAFAAVITALSKGKGPVTRDGVTYIPYVDVHAKIANDKRKALKAVPAALQRLRDMDTELEI